MPGRPEAGVLLYHLGGGERIVVGEVHALGLLVELHDTEVGNDHLGTAVAGKACALTAAGAVHPAARGDVVDVIHEAALLVLHHDDGVAVGGNAVGAAGTGETGGGLQVVALAEDAGGVHVAVRVDLSAADEGNETILVVQPLVGLEADEADVGPLHGAVRHEAVITDGTGDLNGVAVHQAGLNDGVAAGADRALGEGRTDQGQTRTDDDDLVFLDVLSNGISLHFLLGILRIIRHFYLASQTLVCSGIAEVRLVLQAHQTAAADLVEQRGLIFAAVDPLFEEILEGLGDLLAALGKLEGLLGVLGGELELLVLGSLLQRLGSLGSSLLELLDGILGILILGSLVVFLQAGIVVVIVGIALRGPCAVRSLDDCLRYLEALSYSFRPASSSS